MYWENHFDEKILIARLYQPFLIDYCSALNTFINVVFRYKMKSKSMERLIFALDEKSNELYLS